MKTYTNLRIHLVHRHVWDKIVIMDECNRPHPHCPSCDIFLPWAALNFHYPSSELFARAAESKRRLLAEEEARAGAVTALWDYDRPLETVSSFK